jgi:hypothetical protein
MRLFGKPLQRNWNVISQDPQTHFMIGRLLGANEMAIALLKQEDNPTGKLIASVLAARLVYFDGMIPKSEIPKIIEYDTEAEAEG